MDGMNDEIFLILGPFPAGEGFYIEVLCLRIGIGSTKGSERNERTAQPAFYHVGARPGGHDLRVVCICTRRMVSVLWVL